MRKPLAQVHLGITYNIFCSFFPLNSDKHLLSAHYIRHLSRLKEKKKKSIDQHPCPGGVYTLGAY